MCFKLAHVRARGRDKPFRRLVCLDNLSGENVARNTILDRTYYWSLEKLPFFRHTLHTWCRYLMVDFPFGQSKKEMLLDGLLLCSESSGSAIVHFELSQGRDMSPRSSGATSKMIRSIWNGSS